MLLKFVSSERPLDFRMVYGPSVLFQEAFCFWDVMNVPKKTWPRIKKQEPYIAPSPPSPGRVLQIRRPLRSCGGLRSRRISWLGSLRFGAVGPQTTCGSASCFGGCPGFWWLCRENKNKTEIHFVGVPLNTTSPSRVERLDFLRFSSSGTELFFVVLTVVSEVATVQLSTVLQGGIITNPA